MGDSKIAALAFIILFWSLLTIVSGHFEQEIIIGNVRDLSSEGIEVDDNNIVHIILNGLDDVPIVNEFVPLFRIMSFSYTDTVPEWISLILIVFSVISAYLVYTMVRGY